MSRRQFLLRVGNEVCAGLNAFFRVSAETEVATPELLRPPTAPKNDANFVSFCTQCSLCVEVCPAAALKMDKSNGGAPYFVARESACTQCKGLDELQCVLVCPTPALAELSNSKGVELGHQVLWEHRRIGLAIINKKTCYAQNGTTCRSCYQACPYPNKAIFLDDRLRPTVIAEACTGCGLCEQACIAKSAAIQVVSHRRSRIELVNSRD